MGTLFFAALRARNQKMARKGSAYLNVVFFLTTFLCILTKCVSSFSLLAPISRDLGRSTKLRDHVHGDVGDDATRTATSSGEANAERRDGDDDEERRTVTIAVTREEGNNGKILRALRSHSRIPTTTTSIAEIPCIEHADGPDSGDSFVAALSSMRSLSTSSTSNDGYDYVVVTSPEAARVFAAAWDEATPSSVDDRVATTTTTTTTTKICAVGKATEQTLTSKGFTVDFVPSKATAKTLVEELPPAAVDDDDEDRSGVERAATKVLYPASAQAKTTLQEGLEARTDAAFEVTRLNTYDTVPATWSDERLRLARSGVDVVCFASPSAVDSWTSKVNDADADADGDRRLPLSACIGETSAQACREKGWREEDIFYPEKPGVQGWADSVADAVEKFIANGKAERG